MADQYSNLVGAMDQLWFHNIILFSKPMSALGPKTNPKILLNSPSNSNLSSPSEKEILSDSSPISPQDDFNNDKEKPTSLNLDPNITRLHSSSSLEKKIPKHLIGNFSDAAERRLMKTMSCKSLWELEYEEVKGFMDLGFTFKKEQLSPRMMSVIPGLQRLGECLNAAAAGGTEEDEIEEVEEKRGVMRPYLSEAWLIKRPDSPLLNLRLPGVKAAADMKKHLRFWARTVASVIQQKT